MNPLKRVFHRSIVKPVEHPQGEEILGAIDLFARKLDVAFQRIHVERGDGQLVHAIAGK